MRIHYFSRRTLLVLALLVLAALALLLAVLLRPPAARVSGSGEKLLPVYQVDTDQQAVALSFDASWGAEYTRTILDVLDQYQAKATFFLVNIWLEDYPELAAEIAQRGHEIGLHSATHPHFTQLSREQMINELQSNYALINRITGQEPRLFRCPYGDYDSSVIAAAQSCGYISVQWSVDSWDWMDLTAPEICDRVLADLGPGDIVLMHNNGLHTAEALPDILAHLAEQGLEAVTLSELLLEGEWYVDVNGVQRPQA